MESFERRLCVELQDISVRAAPKEVAVDALEDDAEENGDEPLVAHHEPPRTVKHDVRCAPLGQGQWSNARSQEDGGLKGTLPGVQKHNRRNRQLWATADL